MWVATRQVVQRRKETMYLDQTQVLAPQQTINISAKLIASIKVLQYSSEELEQAIATELRENPALEVEEQAQCLRCGAGLHGGLCLSCDRAACDGAAAPQAEVGGWEDEHLPQVANLALAAESDFDPLDFLSTGATLEDHLLRQLSTILEATDLPIAEFLVGSLNSHGYVTTTTADACEVLGVPEACVARVFDAFHSLDPPGIGARNLQECLQIQLRGFEERGEAPPVARRLLEDYLYPLGEHHFTEIARELGVTVAAVKQAWRFIRANLYPYPAHAFEATDVSGQGLTSGNERSVIVRPDVIIRRMDRGFEAEIIEQRRFRFGLNSLYYALYRQCRAHRHAQEELSEPEQQHVREYATRARFFIECVRQRWETLGVIANALIEYQEAFLAHGVRHLRPLTRGELASQVGLHESTVSRATADKYVLLPSGRTISFDDFFDGSLGAKDQLRELIAEENRAKPYSDEDLAALLRERGLSLARRTVAKYREALGILPSRFRV
jgi:RNA polymerase sigma-54 factor